MSDDWKPIECRVVPDASNGYWGDGEYLLEDDTTDLTIPSFERVTYFDFEDDDEPLRAVKFVRVVDDDDLDW